MTAQRRQVAISGTLVREQPAPSAGRTLHLSRQRRVALTAVAMVVLAVVMAAWVAWLVSGFREHLGVFDFSQYYAAAHALRLDPHANIYSAVVLDASGAAGHVAQQPPLPYLYTVLPVLLLIPLTLLPFAIAAQVWFALNTCIWLGATLLLAVELRHLLRDALHDVLRGSSATGNENVWGQLIADPSWPVALAGAAALSFVARPTTLTLALGQINLMVLLAFALLPGMLRHHQERAIGVTVALATMVKLTPVLLLGYLALTRRWKALAWAVGALAVLSLAGIAVVGPQTFFALLPALQTNGMAAAAFANNESLVAPAGNALLAALPSLDAIIHVAIYAMLAGLAWAMGTVLAISARHAPAETGEQERAAFAQFAIAVCGVLLLLPTYVEAHHYAMLLPAEVLIVGLLAREWLCASNSSRARAALYALGFGVLACALMSLPLPNGWDSDPFPRASLLFSLPLRPWLQELRPLGALLLAFLGARCALGTLKGLGSEFRSMALPALRHG
ncbi:MAG TPA: glycosyltransferase family 87 protein [Ktedonobacterales bacterium]